MAVCQEGSPDKTTFILIVYEVEGVIGPYFLDLLNVFLKSHLNGNK
jgi:hypothetical protein